MNNEWIYFACHSDCENNRNLLIGNLRIKSGCKEFSTSVLLQGGYTVMSDVTLQGENLLTQNCTSVTLVNNCV